jgi:hypothetical protein
MDGGENGASGIALYSSYCIAFQRPLAYVKVSKVFVATEVCHVIAITDTRVGRTSRRMEVNSGKYEREESVIARGGCEGVIPRAFRPWSQYSKHFKLVS